MNAWPATRTAVRLELVAETLRQFSEVRFIARGSSMLPTIYPGDCLTVNCFGTHAPRCGEVVLYRRAGEFRVHRIAALAEEGSFTSYILRGDSLTENDPPVAACDLLGRVTWLERGGSFLRMCAAQTVHQRIARWMVRHSRIVVALLLRWHAVRQKNFIPEQSLAATSATAKTERA